MTDQADSTSGIMIDAPGTPDRDDAVWVTESADGFQAWVHIALVAPHILIGSTADGTARQRMHSRYLPDRTIAMLPAPVEQRAGLRPETVQPTYRIAMRFSRHGEHLDTQLGTGTLRHAHAISYADAATALTDPNHRLHQPLSSANALAQALLGHRRGTGALAFYDLFRGYATTEEGQLVKLGDNQRNAGYVIVQELMIAANAAIATRCAEADIPLLFRNHRVSAVAGDREELLAELTSAEAHGNPLTYELLRKRMSMVQRSATYEPAVYGHYGLSLPAYAHNTSPLRRYPDLVNQRILVATADGQPSPYRLADLTDLGADLTERIVAERARRAERYKASAGRRTRDMLAATDYHTLTAGELAKVLKLGVRQADPAPALVAEAERRFAAGELPLRDLHEIYLHARDERWTPLRHRINEHLAVEPGRALTMVSMYAQEVIGGPIGDEHLRWHVIEAGQAHPPHFQAQLTLRLGDASTTSPARTETSKKEARAQAALGLLAGLADLPDLSHSADAAAPQHRPTAPARPVPADRNPVMAINEYTQMGVITAPTWQFDRDGPSHEPTFTCRVSAELPAGAGPITATGTASGKQAAKTAAAQRLRLLLERRLDLADECSPA